jgi:hypothetical protein
MEILEFELRDNSATENTIKTLRINGVNLKRFIYTSPEGRRPLGRPRLRWEDNIKMDLREIGFGDMDWIHWAQDRDRWRALVNTVMNHRVP